MDNKGQLNVAQIVIGVLVFLIVLTVYGQVYSANIVVANVGDSGVLTRWGNQTLGTGATNLLPLIPLVLVGAAIIGVILYAFNATR